MPAHPEASAFHGIHPWQRLKRLLRTESTELWIVVIYSGAIGLVSLVLPVAVQALVNTVAFGTVLQPLVVLTILVFIALGFSTLLNGLRTWVVELIQRRIFVRTAGDVTVRLVNVRHEAFDHYHGPELVNRFLEVVTVQKAASSLLVEGLSVFMQTAIGMILLAVYHPWLLAFDVLLLVFFAIVLFPLGTGAIPTSIKESKAKYELVAWLQEIARHEVAFKTHDGHAFALDRTNELVVNYLTYRARHFRILLRQIIGSFTLQAIASSVLLGVGGWLVISRQLTLGQLVAAELVVALVVSGFTKFGKHLETFYDLMAATDKLGYIEDLPLERTGGEDLPRLARGAQIRLQGASTGYETRERLLQDADWTIPAGARVGLTGPIGSGKSTLLDLLYGLRSPSPGFVEIDGHDYRDLALGGIRSQAYLVRSPEIFDGTIFDNLRLGDATLDSAGARQALDQTGLLPHVNDLPEGLKTRLATGGPPLSPGQSIQLAIARAIVHQPRLLILDECLDHLEDLPERDRLMDVLFDRSAPWTLIVASENPFVLRRCEKVYTLADSRIQERS